MKRYQLYVKKAPAALDGQPAPGVGWQYGATFTDAKLAWAGLLLARSWGCVVKVITATEQVSGIDNGVLDHG